MGVGKNSFGFSGCCSDCLEKRGSRSVNLSSVVWFFFEWRDASGIAAEVNDSATDELPRSSFYEKRYHISCDAVLHDLPMSSSDVSFYGLKFHELHDHLLNFLGVKHELEEGISWATNDQVQQAIYFGSLSTLEFFGGSFGSSGYRFTLGH
ncbi:inositol-3-phosphate synthase [Striga asiatica]|uniref:Inositol-3-phosphate synthase n=1 Tax=Striga asiatica TaxID=4170 RepID=A0A5A7PX84_STRAF|nr:inositol-3-phosphate synthase [Striga asiatica]